MRNKFIFYVIGVINIFEGLLGLFLGKVYIRHWHNINIYEAFIWLFSGFICIYIARRLKEKEEKISKCPKCKETFNYNELEDGKCKYCKDIDTIDIDEYYEKFPEELENK